MIEDSIIVAIFDDHKEEIVDLDAGGEICIACESGDCLTHSIEAGGPGSGRKPGYSFSYKKTGSAKWPEHKVAIKYKGKNIGGLHGYQEKDGNVRVEDVQVDEEHRGQGLAQDAYHHLFKNVDDSVKTVSSGTSMLPEGEHVWNSMHKKDSSITVGKQATGKKLFTKNIHAAGTQGKWKLQDKYNFQGLDIAIENKKGSTRSGKEPNGKPWSQVMPYDYGYVEGTEGTDGDEVDVFIGPEKDAKFVYIVHQNTTEAKNASYDEDKCMLGFPSADAAKKAYHSAYSNVDLFHSMTMLPIEEFKKKVFEGKDKIHAAAKTYTAVNEYSALLKTSLNAAMQAGGPGSGRHKDVFTGRPSKRGYAGPALPISVVPISSINKNYQGTGVLGKLNNAKISRYAKAMQEGKKFPLLLISNKGNKLNLADGRHRLAAYEKAFPKATHIQVAQYNPNKMHGTAKDDISQSFGAPTKCDFCSTDLNGDDFLERKKKIACPLCADKMDRDAISHPLIANAKKILAKGINASSHRSAKQNLGPGSSRSSTSIRIHNKEKKLSAGGPGSGRHYEGGPKKPLLKPRIPSEDELDQREALLERRRTTDSAKRAQLEKNGKSVRGKPIISEKAMRAKANVQLATKEQQDLAEGTEAKVQKHLGKGASRFNQDSEPYDIVHTDANGKKHGIEVKTMITAKNDRINQKPEAIARKNAYAKKNKIKGQHTVVVDYRQNANKPDVYHAYGHGNFRLGGMTKVAGGLKGLKAHIV